MYDEKTIKRFWEKVDKSEGADACWPWKGAKRDKGYGGIKIKGRVIRAHRAAWEIRYRTSLGERMALHHCDNPACCNPKHIYAGDAKQNQTDVKKRRRRTHDKLTPEAAAEIRMYHEKYGTSALSLANDFGVSRTAIGRVIRGETYVDY